MTNKGITAAMIIFAFMLSITILSGIGFYEEMGISIAPGVDNETEQVNSDLQGVEVQDRGDGIFSGFTTGTATALSTLWRVVFQTPVLIKTFLPVGNAVAQPIGRFIQFLFGLGFVLFVRGIA